MPAGGRLCSSDDDDDDGEEEEEKVELDEEGIAKSVDVPRVNLMERPFEDAPEVDEPIEDAP